MNVEQGRSYFPVIIPFTQFPAYDGGIQESLEYVIGTFGAGREQRFYAGRGVGLASRLVVHNAEYVVLAVHTVDDSPHARADGSLGCLYLYVLHDPLFGAYEGKGSVAQVVAKQLLDIAQNYGGIDELYPVVFRTLVSREMEEQFLESVVHVIL